MNASKGSAVVVGDQGPQCRLPGLGVVPDSRGESGEALEDPGEDALIGSATVALQVELALQGVVYRFDELAQRPQELAVGPGLLVGTGRADERRALALATARPPAWALAGAKATGRPEGVQIRCRRSPQNHREWRAQYP